MSAALRSTPDGGVLRDARVVRRRRMGRGVDYERLDEYKEDGEPDWEAQDKKRRLQVTVRM